MEIPLSRFGKNKSISRILSTPKRGLIIYLDAPLPIRSIDLPAGIGRATLKYPAYLVFQLMRFTVALDVATKAVGSYSTFSPLPRPKAWR